VQCPILPFFLYFLNFVLFWYIVRVILKLSQSPLLLLEIIIIIIIITVLFII